MNIKSFVREVIQEAATTRHLDDRLMYRFMLNAVPEFPIQALNDPIKLLKLVDFPKEIKLAVNIFRSNNTFTTHTQDNPLPMKGNNVWVIIKNNTMVTAVLRPDGAWPGSGVEQVLSICAVKKIIHQKGDLNVELSDLVKKSSQEPKRARRPGLDLPTITLMGKQWYIDYQNEQVILIKNTKNRVTFDRLYDTLPESELESLLSQITV